LSPDSRTRAVHCGERGGACRLAVLPFALALTLAAVAAPAAGASEDPVRLWAEYPLDPAAAGARSREFGPRPAATRKAERGPTAGAAIAVPGEESGLPVWTLSLAIVAGVALVGMSWLAMLVRTKDARWETARAPRRRRSRAPVVLHNANAAGERTRATGARGGIHYRD
jgi:hypothetical protein